MDEEGAPVANRTVPTRLDAIRALFASFDDGSRCECEQCVAGRELLAVVDAVLGESTLEKKAYWAREYADNGRFWYDQKTAKHYDAVAAAWDALS